MLVESILEHGSGVINEDSLVVTDTVFGVFDGATSLNSTTYESGFSGGFLAANLARDAFLKKRGALVESAEQANSLIRHAMAERNVDLGWKGNLWSTSAAVVRVQDEMLEWVQIGDCRIICVFDTGEFELLCDIPDQDVETLSQWKEVGQFTDDPIGVAMHEQILKVRSRMNVDYGVFSGEPEAMDFLQSGTRDLEGISHVLLFTDGLLMPSADPRQVRAYDEQIGLYQRAGLKGVRDCIRDIESTDVGCRVYPRFKTHDDIAAIAVNV